MMVKKRTLFIFAAAKLLFLISLTYLSVSSAVECPPGQYQVREHPRSDYNRNNGTHVSRSHVRTYCKEYQNFKPLVLKFQEKKPRGWPYKKEKFKKWTELEKKKIFATINELPKVLSHVGELNIFRAYNSETMQNPATSSPDNNIIVIYDSLKSNNYKKVLAHELAHILYASLPIVDARAYIHAASWKENIDGSFSSKRTDFSEEDGKLGPDEDFANNIEHFLFDKNAQKALNKEIYDCLEKILGKKNE